MTALILFLLAVFLPTGIGILFVKHHDQKRRDKGRKTYRLSFPNDLTEASVTAFMRAISGTLRFGSTRLVGVPTVAFELRADSTGLSHYLKVPWSEADTVLPALRSLVPGIRVTPEDKWLPRKWTRAVEIGLTRSSRPLRIFEVSDVSASLLASMQALEADEEVVMVWVVTPAIPKPLPIYKDAHSDHVSLRHLTTGTLANRDEIKARREKLSDANFMSVLRVAAVAKTPARADHLIHRVRAALASTRAPQSRFVKRMVSKTTLQKRLDRTSGSVVFPIQLSAPELAALIAWPIGNPTIPGLARPLGKQFPPNGAVPLDGVVLGDSSFPGRERPVAIGFSEMLMHTHVLGKTGVGKSVVLAHMARQIMDAGFGLILMETEGNLYQSVLDYVPKERFKDVILMDISDQEFPVGLNVLDQGNTATVIDEIMDLFRHKFGKDGMGIWSQEYIYHGLRTIAERPELTFIDIVTLLNPTTSEEVAWVDRITRETKDQELKRWWQRHENRDKRSQQQRADPVLSRVWQLASRPELRFILGQSKSTFQMRDVLANNKILLVNLKGVSRDTASLTGTLLMNALWHAVKTTEKQRATYLLLDEFADFMDLPIDTESMLAQARKHKLGMVLANQHMSQLKPSVREAIISNARNKLIFQANADDGTALKRELAGEIDVHDVTSLQTYEAIASIVTPVGPSGPISITTRAPGRSTAIAKHIVKHSRAQYGTPIAKVRRAIESRYEPPTQPNTSRAKIGSESPWDNAH